LIVQEVGYDGIIIFDKTTPDATLRELMDTSKINNVVWSERVGQRVGVIQIIK
jgi:GDP-L-fucose synthase